MRCCQRPGFQGFQDLKITLAQEALPAVARLQGEVAEGDPPATVLAKVVEAGAEAIRSAVATVNPDAFERAITVLGAAGGVLVVGAGTFALTEVAAITLVAGSRETNFRLEAMASRMAHLTVLDALFVAVALRDRQRALAAQDIHAAIMAEHRF